MEREERESLRDLFGSPGWGLVKQALAEQEFVLVDRLTLADEPREVFHLQGTIEGIRALLDLENTLLQTEEAEAQEATNFLRRLLNPPTSLGMEEERNGRRERYGAGRAARG